MRLVRALGILAPLGVCVLLVGWVAISAANVEAASLSLAAASARIAALERVIGTRLLDRSKAGAAPTDAGRALAAQH